MCASRFSAIRAQTLVQHTGRPMGCLDRTVRNWILFVESATGRTLLGNNPFHGGSSVPPHSSWLRSSPRISASVSATKCPCGIPKPSPSQILLVRGHDGCPRQPCRMRTSEFRTHRFESSSVSWNARICAGRPVEPPALRASRTIYRSSCSHPPPWQRWTRARYSGSPQRSGLVTRHGASEAKGAGCDTGQCPYTSSCRWYCLDRFPRWFSEQQSY
jgi:hypothetical protein